MHEGQGGPAAGVVQDFPDDPLDVPVALGEVEGAEFGRPLPALGVGFEHGSRTFTLSANHTSHFWSLENITACNITFKIRGVLLAGQIR